jgi:hypothetical protein
MVYAYMVPELGEGTNLILGTLWMRDQRVIVEAKGPWLRLIDRFAIKSIRNEPKLVVR